jgi:predicted metalloprotease with PDZ domain
MSENPEVSTPVYSSMTTCTNCHSPMPAELRFCRNCGFRLGEGIAEYNETIRFDGVNVPGRVAAPTAVPVRKKRKMSGMAWIFVALLVFFVGAAAFTAVLTPIRQSTARIITPPKPQSYVGVDEFNTTDGGVTFECIDTPGGPADLAGLVGGDVITVFDGQAVHDEDQMKELMQQIPIGKTVDIEYLRDGEKKTGKLTTVSRDELRKLGTAFERRPEGRTQFGYEDGDAKRVEIPGTKLHGVQLNRILPSRPADLAGIKEGDIVIQFDDIPIRTSDEFLMRVRRALPYSTVKITVMRNGEKLEIPVKVGRQ